VKNKHVLSEYYPVPPDAKKPLQEGAQKILKEKGGFLCIPADAATARFVPRNREGHQVVPDPLDPRITIFESVTVTDARRGVERTYLPPVGAENSELTAFAGRIKERDLAVDLGWQGTYSVESLCSRLEGGGSSYSMRLFQKTNAGEHRFYVPTLMGIFPGQRAENRSARGAALHRRSPRAGCERTVFRGQGGRAARHPGAGAALQQAQRQRALPERHVEF